MSAADPEALPRLRVAITGASGLVGTALVAHLEAVGHRVHTLVRRAPQPGSRELAWDPSRAGFEPAAATALAECDAIVHLAGHNVAAARWNAAQKAAIRDSRVGPTAQLCAALAALPQRPRALISASGVGFYGARGDEPLEESAAIGEGFFPAVCRDWEAACAPARAAGMRVVNLRTGMVVSSAGGALPRMLTPFRLGLGGRIGDGRQWMSWIAHADLIAAIAHLLQADAVDGPVNGTAPTPVTNAEFTRVLAHVLRRPALLPLPAFAVRLLLGEMGQALLLDGARVLPRRLEASGFVFKHPGLESALRAELGLQAC